MYEYLKGNLVEANSISAILDVRGIGYKILIPVHLVGKISLGKEICFFISFIVREDAHSLYGFIEKNERDLFEKLVSISGIGPKTALSIIGHLPLAILTHAIKNNHLPTLTQVPGIGKKTAERLLLELRDKISSFSTTDKGGIVDAASSKLSDALSALINLGYSPTIAKGAIDKAMKDLPEECDLPTLISHALKKRA